jgi:hypothetical protein
MWIKRIFLILLLCRVTWAVNDFSGDPNCKALWSFENGALTTDSIGSNTLTQYHTPVADTVNYKEGAASCDFEAGDNDGFYIADADLDSGFPLKSDDATKSISVCMWVKFESLTNYRMLYQKSDSGKNCLEIFILNTQYPAFEIGYNSGTSWDLKTFGTQVATGKWYHIAVTFKNSDKSYRMRIWDDDAGALLGADLTGTATNNINVEDAYLRIGHSWFSGAHANDGLIDEIVVFDDILSTDEIDQIRAGTYGAAAGGSNAQVIIISKWFDWRQPLKRAA